MRKRIGIDKVLFQKYRPLEDVRADDTFRYHLSGSLDAWTFASYPTIMRNRSRKPREDVNQIAHSIMQAIADGDVPQTPDGKNPFAVALGRKGGLVGGKARAARMTDKQRSESARKAAQARWRRQADK